ncbi:hypothetical protein GYMLUDRAFT_62077 [Collybiopsis luxurians FD-317 M1]|uniref:Unplaced genomic scaffold GYMLUscaffold_50, whole genome shotgun sequence n=1 Tax=Collybiopsis luxurians FD-317 M1 TaxID=944289 RepID=A0A0D0B0A9_9AGAR|nr:hypothetical protein GYMLUDRAFT_62077 [Collybiopsis luxurians FD-317 M1]
MSSDLTQIDPQLLTPAQQMIRRQQLKEKEKQVSPQDSLPIDADFPQLAALSSSASMVISTLNPSLLNLGQQQIGDYVNTLKRKFDLQPQDCTDLDELVSATAEERYFFQTALLLANRKDQLKLINSLSDKLPAALKTCARSFTFSILVSPHISSYSGKNFADIVVKCMHSSGVDGIPAENQPVKLKELKTLISECATSDRYAIKNKVVLSIAEVDSSTRNIALLAKAIIGTHGSAITPDLLARIAVIKSRDFWGELDKSIDCWRGDGGFKQHRNSVEMWQSIHFTYEDDVKTYGDPVNTEVQITDI